MTRMPIRTVGVVVALGLAVAVPSARRQVPAQARSLPPKPPPQVQTETRKPDQRIPAFRSRITLVPLDVRVLDRDGRPVTDLTRADFTILEGSEPQTIAHFGAHGLVPERPLRQARPAFRQAPADTLAPQRGRTFLFVLGRGRIEKPFDAIVATIQFVRERLLPQHQVAVMAYNRVTDFTTEHERIASVLERYKDRHERIEALLLQYELGPAPRYKKCHACLPDSILPRINDIFMAPGAIVSRELPQALTEDDSGSGNRAQRFVDALLETDLGGHGATSPGIQATSDLLGKKDPYVYLGERVREAQEADKLLNGITALRYLDGEKHLVFLSEKGLSLVTHEEDVVIQRAAADARIVIDTILTGGLQYDILAAAALKELAEKTGGVTAVTKYPREALGTIDDVSRFEYLLGYYPTNGERDSKFRHVEVKVNRPDLTVLVRRGYYANDVLVPSDPAAFVTYERIAGVGHNRDLVSDVKLTMKVSQAKSADRKTPGDVLVEARIDAARLGLTDVAGRHTGRLEVRVYCGDAHEQIVGQMWNTLSLNLSEESYRRYLRDGIPYTARIPVSAAPRHVKIVVYDVENDLAGSMVAQVKK